MKRRVDGKDTRMDSYMKANLDWWNEAVGVHAQGDTYGLESFKAGMSRLKYLEREEVGEVAGKSLLHLQCHFGLDTLSWARLGRKRHRCRFFRECHCSCQIAR